mgnify:CR=1 FL=1
MKRKRTKNFSFGEEMRAKSIRRARFFIQQQPCGVESKEAFLPEGDAWFLKKE